MRKWIAPLLIVAAFAFSLIVYSRLPERVPVHWGVHGNVNRYGSRAEAAFVVPTVMLAVWLLLRFLPRIDPRRANYEKFADTYELLINSFIAVFAVIHVSNLGTALGWPIAMQRLVPVLVGLLFIILGNALPRARPNWWFGIRTPWTLSNDRVWMRTHRVAGYLFAGAGVVLLVAAFLPSAWTFALGVTAVGAAAFGSFVYSYFAWKQETGK